MSIFKRIFGQNEDVNNNLQLFKTQNTNVKSMGHSLQKRFSRGVQYNMKILIRGDRNVGKSALLARLKGLEFTEQYIPTDEIEVASIHWNYKNSEDVIKVEVWDVVDKGRSKKMDGGLKWEAQSTAKDKPSSLCLDAEFLDVYKGAHGVIMVLDMTKLWTLHYVERELPLVPADIPVLVLANHKDMGHHRTISQDQVQAVINSAIDEDGSRDIRYWESSMQNGYGLVYVHRFLSLPFLQLQRRTLFAQLETNQAENKRTAQQLTELENSPDSTYDAFMKNLRNAKRPQQEQQRQSVPPSSLPLHKSNPASQITSPITPTSASTSSDLRKVYTNTSSGTVTTPEPRNIKSQNPIHVPQARPIPGMDRLGLYPLPVPDQTSVAQTSTSDTENNVKKVSLTTNNNLQDEECLSAFLDDTELPVPNVSNTTVSANIINNDLESSDSSDEPEANDSNLSYSNRGNVNNSTTKSEMNNKKVTKSGNPMVAAFQDDIDEIDSGDYTRSTDLIASSSGIDCSVSKNITDAIIDSSDEEEYVADKRILENGRKIDAVSVNTPSSNSVSSEIMTGNADDSLNSQRKQKKHQSEETTGKVKNKSNKNSAKKKSVKKHKSEKKNKEDLVETDDVASALALEMFLAD